MKTKEKQVKGVLFTIGFNAMILMILLLFGFTTPLPLPEEEGVMVDFGDSDTGMGLVEPTKQEEAVSTPPNSAEEANMTQNFEEAIAVKEQKQNTTEQKVEKTETQKIEEQRKIDAAALYSNNSSESSSSSSEGNAGGNGNQGKPNGDPNSNQYNGTGVGKSGIGWSLQGRSVQALPKPAYNSNEQGDVVVKITVDRDGRVVSAVPGYKGTTTMDSGLLNAAKQAALNTRFDKNPNAQATQSGTITYRFVLK